MGESYKIFTTSTCKKCCVVFSFKLNIDSFIRSIFYDICMPIYSDIILENNYEWEQTSNFKICLVH